MGAELHYRTGVDPKAAPAAAGSGLESDQADDYGSRQRGRGLPAPLSRWPHSCGAHSRQRDDDRAAVVSTDTAFMRLGLGGPPGEVATGLPDVPPRTREQR